MRLQKRDYLNGFFALCAKNEKLANFSRKIDDAKRLVTVFLYRSLNLAIFRSTYCTQVRITCASLFWSKNLQIFGPSFLLHKRSCFAKSVQSKRLVKNRRFFTFCLPVQFSPHSTLRAEWGNCTGKGRLVSRVLCAL